MNSPSAMSNWIASHAPRERVSWNEDSEIKDLDKYVTLHVSVWVEIAIAYRRYAVALRHAPRERVSWNDV